LWKKRLAEYQAPALDEGLRDGLRDFIGARKAAVADAWY
jgi:trimethylamine--corrinoid protein Co-methyltransferase